MVYTHNDRLIVGGAMPAGEALTLEPVDLVKSEFFCQRREEGVICIAGEGVLSIDGTEFRMGFKDAVYVGRGARQVTFRSIDALAPTKFYFASAPAHKAYSTAQITAAMRRTRELGSAATSS